MTEGLLSRSLPRCPRLRRDQQRRLGVVGNVRYGSPGRNLLRRRAWRGRFGRALRGGLVRGFVFSRTAAF